MSTPSQRENMTNETTERERALFEALKQARKHIMEWWRPEGDLPPAKSWEFVERLDALLTPRGTQRCEECVGTGKCGPDENLSEMDCEVCSGAGVDAAASPSMQVAPSEWKLVPVEPTHEMCEAVHFGPNCAEHEMRASDREFWEATYAAMLAAAPVPQVAPEQTSVRAQALGECADLCAAICQDYRDQYKGQGKYATGPNPRHYDTHCDGLSDGASDCEDAIRALISKGATPSDDAITISHVCAALAEYYDALTARQHLGVAAGTALNKIERAMGMTWEDHKAAQRAKGGA